MADREGRGVATAVTGQDGFFRVAVSAGTYRVSEDITGVGQVVQVQGGQQSTVRLSIAAASG